MNRSIIMSATKPITHLATKVAATLTVWLLPIAAWASPEAPVGPPAVEVGHGVDHHGVEWITPIVNHKGQIGLLWLFINFAVLMWILEKLLFSKLRARQREKHDVVRTELERATAARTEAESVMAEYRGRMERLEAEAAALLDEARQRAETDRRRILEEAELEATRIRSSAQAAAEREAEIRRRQLEAEVVDRAVARAEALLRERITPDDQHRMVDAYVGQITAIQKLEDASSSSQGGAT